MNLVNLPAFGHAIEFVKDQFRHCKTILALGAGERLLAAASIPPKEKSGGSDPGLLRFPDAKAATKPFIAAVAKHRHFERQTDPPLI